MSATVPPIPTADRFPSLKALREAHAAFLKAFREGGKTAEQLSAVRAFLTKGTAAGAVLEDNEERLTAQNLLDYWVTAFYRAGEEPPDATLAPYDPELAPEIPESLCPYRGLDAFREEDSHQFFGRKSLLQKLLKRLRERRLLAVVGPSGSGKSSLVYAGLLPALKQGGLCDSQTWRYLRPIVPGSDPRANLVAALRASGIEPPPSSDQLWIPALLDRLGPEPVVLVIDQFEELFTLCDDASVREQFLQLLFQLVTAPGARHTVTLTMRIDYRERVASFLDFFEQFDKGEVLVTPLTARELREAIGKPAERIGLKFEAGVVDRLIQDVLGEPALPLLQFTLLKLWDLRQRNLVTWSAYNALGNAYEALDHFADEFYKSLIQEEKEEVKRLLLKLVRPTEAWEFTSHRIRRDDLLQSDNRKRAQCVLDKLIKARLVRLTRGETPADDQVEVAHEALVRNWKQLVDWLSERKEMRRQKRELEAKLAKEQRPLGPTRLYPQDSKARDADVSAQGRNATRDGNNEQRRSSSPMGLVEMLAR